MAPAGSMLGTLLKAIGAGVNEWEVCEQLAKAGDFDMFLLAGRYTLLEQEALETFLPLCERQGVGIALTNLNATMSMTDWLMSGALARFPKLKIAFSESQVGWMPFLMERVDSVFVKSKAWAGLDPRLTELPSSYVKGRVFGCFFDDMTGVDLRHRIGIEQLVFETDYPHQDSTWPHTDRTVAEIARRVPPNELEMLVRTNAIAMLDLDPADLRPGAAGRAR